MSILEKILEDIDSAKDEYGMVDYINGKPVIAKEQAKEIIRNHLPENDGWIPVEEGLPKEHDSIFAKWKGTERWSNAMFEKISDDVNVTVEYEDGTRNTITMHTLDGKWKYPNGIIQQKVIAWQPLPASYRPKEENNV